MNQAIRKITKAINEKLFKVDFVPHKNWLCPPKEISDSIVAKCSPRCTYEAPLNSLKLVVFDTETTGFDCNKGDEIISISGVTIENGELTNQVFDSLVNPYRPIPQEITELTGISDQMVISKPSVFYALDDFLSFAQDSVLVAHHASFDISFINHKLRNYCNAEMKLPVLDTALITRVFQPTLPRYDLDFLIQYFDLPTEGRHTSLGDSIITAHLFLKLTKLMSKRQVVCLQDLDASLRWRHLTTSI